MVRTVYLIRHAMPDLPLGERWCVGGRTDLPLGPLGLMQAVLLSRLPQLQSLPAVFCSPLSRARETALALSPAPLVMPGLEEQDMGVWDGLSFAEIMRRFPELYAARQQDPDLLPEGAESDDALRARVRAALFRCLSRSDGDIAVVSHKSAIASLVGSRSSLGYASVTRLCAEGKTLRTEEFGSVPHPSLDEALCLALLQAAGADGALIAHCEAVAEKALRICHELGENASGLDVGLIRRASLLHDVAKGYPRHAELGARWLEALGYPEEASLVRQHNEPDSPGLTEAAILFLADKTVRKDKSVSLEDRFASTRDRCQTPEAAEAHARRLEKALRLKQEINALCGAALIE